MTSLREFNKITGHNKQIIRKGDVMIVHDDKLGLQWKLAVVEDLIKGNDDLISPFLMTCLLGLFVLPTLYRTDNIKITRLIIKLYPLEVSSGKLEIMMTVKIFQVMLTLRLRLICWHNFGNNRK